MAHGFTLELGEGRFMIGPGPVEGWANLVNLRALEQAGAPEGALGHPLNEPAMCAGLSTHLTDGTYADFRADPWLPLCMLFELKEQHGGWPLFEKFFAHYRTLDPSQVPDKSDSDGARWSWLRDQLNTQAGVDTTAIFTKFKIPLNR